MFHRPSAADLRRAPGMLGLLLALLLGAGQALAQTPPADAGSPHAAAQGQTQGQTPQTQAPQAQAPQAQPADAAGPRTATAELPKSKMSALDMYRQADWVVKGIMWVLLLCSVLSWTVWLFKLLELSRLSRHFGTSLAQLSRVRTLNAADPGKDPLAAGMLSVAKDELNAVRTEGSLVVDTLKERVAARIGRIEAHAGKRLALGAGLLASIAAVAPFIGLLGTVWGIMNSFTGIAVMQTASLTVVAPGIAEALLATALGLFAAIPAVILYNATGRQVASCQLLIGDLATQVMCLLSRDLDLVNKPHSLEKAA